jgi:hypothetical protein
MSNDMSLEEECLICYSNYVPDDTSLPMEDYDIPYIKCALCENNSLNNTIFFANDASFCYKGGVYVNVNPYRNTHLCHSCIEKIK